MKITFGKKISFRPLLISLIYFLVVSGICSSLGYISLLFGLVIFLWVVGAYYANAIELEFNYIEFTNSEIKYYDFSRWYKRVLLVLFRKNTMKTIDLKTVKQAKLIGRKKLNSSSFAIPYSPILAALTGALSASQNPFGIQLELTNGKKKYLSLAHEKIYNNQKTLKKANKVMSLIHKHKYQGTKPS